MNNNCLYKTLSFGAIASFAILSACSPNETAGGFSEETNTVAGILLDEKGNPQANVRVFASHTKAGISDIVDTTDSDGKFELALVREGTYGLSATKNKKAMYKLINYMGQSMNIKTSLVSTTSISGTVMLRSDTSANEVYVSIPGSPWESKTSDEGSFKFKSVPQGTYPVLAKSPDPIHFVDAFYVGTFQDGKASFAGPYPTEQMENIMSKVDSAIVAQDTSENDSSLLYVGNNVAEFSKKMTMPISPEYSLQCWWPLDFLSEGTAGTKLSSDARGRTDGAVFYGAPELSDGASRNAIVLNGASQYGIVENDHNALDSATEFTLEAWVNFNKLPKDSVYRKNIVGKLGFGAIADQDVFSLSLVKGECNTKDARLAFFIAEGSGSEGDTLSCDNAVLSDAVSTKEWIYVSAVWDGSSLAMYIDGKLVQTAKTSVKKIYPSSEPIIFGKENLNLKLDDVRLSKKAVQEADVLYRYYQKGGAL